MPEIMNAAAQDLLKKTTQNSALQLRLFMDKLGNIAARHNRIPRKPE
jgi:hypothetical protein